MGEKLQALHVILFAIIVLNILDFFELLDPFWDYIKKLVSWVLVGIVFYRISPSNILLGVRTKLLDLLFVFSAFALSLNDMFRYVRLMRDFMLENASLYTQTIQESGVVTTVINVSEEVFNSANIFGFIDIGAQLSSLASSLTMSTQTVYFAVAHGSEQLVYALTPLGLNGSILSVYNTFIPYFSQWEQTGLMIGVVGLLIIAFLATLIIPIEQKSFLGLIDNGPAHGLARVLARFVLVFLAFLFFFLFVFSLVAEWLAIAIDAPILMIAIIASLVLAHLHRVSFDFTKWEEFVTGFGDVSSYVELFHQKRTVLLGLSGILVLHVMAEILVYLLPFTLPLRDQLYLAQLGDGHDNVFTLVSSVPEVLVALTNLFAWASLLFIPGYIWYKIYCLRNEDHARHYPRFPAWFLGLFTGSLVIMLLSRMIWFRKIDGGGLIGVDFFTQVFTGPAIQVLLVGLGIGILVYVLAQFSIRPFLYLIPLGTSMFFLGTYSFLYFLSSAKQYIILTILTFTSEAYFASLAFGLFALFALLFYIPVFLLFLYEIIRD